MKEDDAEAPVTCSFGFRPRLGAVDGVGCCCCWSDDEGAGAMVGVAGLTPVEPELAGVGARVADGGEEEEEPGEEEEELPNGSGWGEAWEDGSAWLDPVERGRAVVEVSEDGVED